MFGVLNDIALHKYIGGAPSSLDGLRTRYGRLESGSGLPNEIWVNWIARRRSDGISIGTVQATITGDDERRAEIAWVIGIPWQGQGYGSEAAKALVGWLEHHGIENIQAHIRPDHRPRWPSPATSERSPPQSTTTVKRSGTCPLRQVVVLSTKLNNRLPRISAVGSPVSRCAPTDMKPSWLMSKASGEESSHI